MDGDRLCLDSVGKEAVVVINERRTVVDVVMGITAPRGSLFLFEPLGPCGAHQQDLDQQDLDQQADVVRCFMEQHRGE